MRKFIFKLLFSNEEKIAIINALYRRAHDTSTSEINGDSNLRETCSKIARELMS